MSKSSDVLDFAAGSYTIGGSVSKGHQSSQSQPLQIRKKINDWLVYNGYKVNECEPPDDSFWFLQAFQSDTFGFGITQPKKNPAILLLKSNMGLRDFLPYMMAMDAGARKEFLWEVRFYLLSLNIPFGLLADPPELATTMPDAIQVSETVYLQDMTKETFFRRAYSIRRGMIAVQWLFQRKFDTERGGVTFDLTNTTIN